MVPTRFPGFLLERKTFKIRLEDKNKPWRIICMFNRKRSITWECYLVNNLALGNTKQGEWMRLVKTDNIDFYQASFSAPTCWNWSQCCNIKTIGIHGKIDGIREWNFHIWPPWQFPFSEGGISLVWLLDNSNLKSLTIFIFRGGGGGRSVVQLLVNLNLESLSFSGGGGGGRALWTNIPLTREGLSVKFGHKFCAQKTACASQIVSHLSYTKYVETSSILVLVFSYSQQKGLTSMWTLVLIYQVIDLGAGKSFSTIE